jgi:hypothetical protein
MAKKVVDSTFRKILTYTAEIILSIVLLVMICIPLAFAVPGWIQYAIFDTAKEDLLINPVLVFGIDGTFAIIMGLAVFSFIIAYKPTMKLIISDKTEETPLVDIDEDEEEDETSEDSEEMESEVLETEEEEVTVDDTSEDTVSEDNEEDETED